MIDARSLAQRPAIFRCPSVTRQSWEEVLIPSFSFSYCPYVSFTQALQIIALGKSWEQWESLLISIR